MKLDGLTLSAEHLLLLKRLSLSTHMKAALGHVLRLQWALIVQLVLRGELVAST